MEGPTHLGGNPFDRVFGSTIGLCIANGSTIGPLNVKPYDGPFLCGLNGFSMA
jgi:hypothetical protein